MSNMLPSLSIAPSFAAPGAPMAVPAVPKDQNMAIAERLVLNICNPELRERALLELSKKREIFPDLAPLLWHSFGTITALLQEIMSIYPSVTLETLSPGESNRVCNALALLQCVATNSDTRTPFLAAQIPLYLYPFLNTQNKTKQYEYLRLTSLGVIGALVKVDDPEVIAFLITSEIIPLCLRTMEMGSELSKTVATFIVQKIMLDDYGLYYVCSSERYFAIASVLAQMVDSAEHNPSPRLLKHAIRCYLRLTDNATVCSLLYKHKHKFLPISLINGTLNKYLQDDLTMGWLQQLVLKLNSASRGAPHTSLDHMMGM